MLNIKRAVRSDRMMKVLSGMTVTEFERLLLAFTTGLRKED